ncbi:MAG: hypothetical protein PHQ19_08635 [Candidatus Krumholzibacteria bacterium]|nr:hypothetical protein [Candidatus Krumholzibacteria bacterium]
MSTISTAMTPSPSGDGALRSVAGDQGGGPRDHEKEASHICSPPPEGKILRTKSSRIMLNSTP